MLLSPDSQGLHCSSISSINTFGYWAQTQKHTYTHTNTYCRMSVRLIIMQKLLLLGQQLDQITVLYTFWSDLNTGKATQEELTEKHTYHNTHMCFHIKHFHNIFRKRKYEVCVFSGVRRVTSFSHLCIRADHGLWLAYYILYLRYVQLHNGSKPDKITNNSNVIVKSNVF